MTAIEKIIEQVKQHGAPVIEADTAIFVWEGEEAPQIIGEFNSWGWDETSGKTMQEAAPEIWTYTVKLPPDAYIEYFFTPDHTDDDARILDPLNKRRITNGFGNFNNYFSMPAAQHTRLHNVRKKIPRGVVTTHTLSQPFMLVGGKRDVWLYQPPVEQAVPLLLVYDGRDYLKRARIAHIVDNLIAQNKIEPIALAMIENGRQGRFAEYNASEATLTLVMQELIPLAEKHLTLLDWTRHAGVHGVLGASMGGLMALYTGLRLPQVFGRVISQSGAFQFDLAPQSEAIATLFVKTFPKRDLKIWQDVGKFEWLLEANRAMNRVLSDKGYEVTYHEYNGGHNYTCWRNMLPRALETVFGKTGN